MDVFPYLNFQSEELRSSPKSASFELIGQLSLKGVTKPVQLQAIYTGKAVDPYSGEAKIGWQIQGRFDRRHWDVDFNIPFDSPGVAVGNIVEIQAQLEFMREEIHES